ncbi:AEC family transporter [Desulfovibrio inopinatus]|uniref:AEC family transporter n=1 Tax=Desulfovibrio inopinatus TaxID=102109 RepID=UPI00041996F4|nr:AEC family transporter [Desulfovibrio inopinatus]
MEKFLTISIFVAMGAFFKRLPIFPAQTAQVLNMVALYVALPAVILLKVPHIQFTSEMIVPAVLPWGMLLLSAGLVCWGGKVFRWSRETIGVLLLIVPIGNTSFMGVPMVTAFFGEVGIPHLIIYDQAGTMLIFVLYGSAILALFGTNTKIQLSQIVSRIVFFPPSIALMVGLIMKMGVWSYPEPLLRSLTSLSEMLTPLVMIAIGHQLKVRLSPDTLRPMGFGLVVKLIVAPLVALLGCRMLGLNGLAVNVAIFEAAMPPMVTAGALAMAAGLVPELAAAMVSLGMILSFLTLPVLYWIL